MIENKDTKEIAGADVADATAEETATVTTMPLPRQVADMVRNMIIMDELKPGEPIRERIISQTLNISRTPLREGLKSLAAEGLVELIPNRGAVVANPPPEKTRERLMVLGALERLVGQLAAESATDEEIDEITALHYEMLAARKRKDRLQYFKLNQKIHNCIVQATRNGSLIEIHTHINMQVYRHRYRNNLQNHNWDHSIDEHGKIVDALQARDGQLLAELLGRHLAPIWTAVAQPDDKPKAGDPDGSGDPDGHVDSTDSSQ